MLEAHVRTISKRDDTTYEQAYVKAIEQNADLVRLLD